MAVSYKETDAKYVDKVVEKVVQETVRVWEDIDVYHLELNEDEIKTLHDILASVGGNPYNSRRQYADDILNAVEKALDYNDPDTFVNDTEGEVTFQEYSND